MMRARRLSDINMENNYNKIKNKWLVLLTIIVALSLVIDLLSLNVLYSVAESNYDLGGRLFTLTNINQTAYDECLKRVDKNRQLEFNKSLQDLNAERAAANQTRTNALKGANEKYDREIEKIKSNKTLTERERRIKLTAAMLQLLLDYGRIEKEYNEALKGAYFRYESAIDTANRNYDVGIKNCEEESKIVPPATPPATPPPATPPTTPPTASSSYSYSSSY